jgi:hypothetical protein
MAGFEFNEPLAPKSLQELKQVMGIDIYTAWELIGGGLDLEGRAFRLVGGRQIYDDAYVTKTEQGVKLVKLVPTDNMKLRVIVRYVKPNQLVELVNVGKTRREE